MKAKVRDDRKVTTVSTHPNGPSRWPYLVSGLAAILLVFWAYSPSLSGPFLFDDTNLPYTLSTFQHAPLMQWLRADLRPALFFTYYINGTDPYYFHVVNVLIHLIAGGLIFLVVRRLIEWSRNFGDKASLLAGFAAALFLLHPLQTEGIAYVAGRSESLSAMFGLAAFAVFIYRKQQAATWPVVIAVLGLFGLALASKQNAIAIPGLLLLTDFWWNPGFSIQGIRANWKLYAPMVAGAVVGLALFWRVMMTAQTAGFGMKDLTWYQYFFTQCRALFVYLGMFLFPASLNADWDFAISRNVIDHGAIVGLVALLALAGAAWHYRKRFPLASYGFFVFLIMMAPTSSFLPIKDPIAERRLYSAMLGLLLIVVDFLGRVKLEKKVLVAAGVVVLLLAAGVTHARADVWSDPIAFWEDTTRKSPEKRRVRFQMGMAYFSANQFDRAIPEFEKTAQLEPPDYNLLVDWGLALNALNRPEEALAKFKQAVALDATAHVYTQIATVYGQRERWPETLDALATAQKIDVNYAPTYYYRGNVYLKTSHFGEAIQQYRRALELQPDYPDALRNLMLAEKALERQKALQQPSH